MDEGGIFECPKTAHSLTTLLQGLLRQDLRRQGLRLRRRRRHAAVRRPVSQSCKVSHFCLTRAFNLPKTWDIMENNQINSGEPIFLFGRTSITAVIRSPVCILWPGSEWAILKSCLAGSFSRLNPIAKIQKRPNCLKLYLKCVQKRPFGSVSRR